MASWRRKRKKKNSKKKPRRQKEKKVLRNRHHIFPSSKGGTWARDNIVVINQNKHEHYHHVFDNKTPDEIIRYLVDYFWKGQWHWVVKAFKNEEPT